MTYQEIVDNVRNREDYFAKLDGGWPGYYGPARSAYPNLAAELVTRGWQIGTPVEAARVSREVLAGVIEDGDILDTEELRSISDRLGISNQYLCSPVLSTVNPMTNKGRYRIAILKRLLGITDRYGVYCGLSHNNARITLAQMECGIPVTYAIEVIRSLWPIIDVDQIDENDFAALAAYITKESVEGRPVGAQMWTRSRNLKKPKVESCFVPDSTTLAAPLGCHILEKEEKITEYGSYCYIKYRLPAPISPEMRFTAGRRPKERPAAQLDTGPAKSDLKPGITLEPGV